MGLPNVVTRFLLVPLDISTGACIEKDVCHRKVIDVEEGNRNDFFLMIKEQMKWDHQTATLK